MEFECPGTAEAEEAAREYFGADSSITEGSIYPINCSTCGLCILAKKISEDKIHLLPDDFCPMPSSQARPS